MKNVKFAVTDEQAFWLDVAKAAGFQKGELLRSYLEEGQTSGLPSDVRWKIENKIRWLQEHGRIRSAESLACMLQEAIRQGQYFGYPEGYR
jgi:hypothetical protein